MIRFLKILILLIIINTRQLAVNKINSFGERFLNNLISDKLKIILNIKDYQVNNKSLKL